LKSHYNSSEEINKETIKENKNLELISISKGKEDYFQKNKNSCTDLLINRVLITNSLNIFPQENQINKIIQNPEKDETKNLNSMMSKIFITEPIVDSKIFINEKNTNITYLRKNKSCIQFESQFLI